MTYAERVEQLEREGLTTSDAQACADVEFSKPKVDTMTDQATKRPWRTFYEGSGDYLITGPNGEEIASLSRPDAHFMHTGTGADVNEADATIIVQAVNTFDEAKAALERIRDVFDDPSTGKRLERSLGAHYIAHVKAVLSRMEGR